MTPSTLFEENRRFNARVPAEMYVSAYLLDQPQRAVTVDISESGLYLNALVQQPYAPRTPVGLEFRLPTLGETLWVAGETCRDSLDDYFYGFGVRFVRMANLHRRMLREYCFRARRASGIPEPARRLRAPFKI
jgi:c-di-GMP-binding flagellar brake protein YcgR